MILCDTNVLIEFYKNNPQITAAFRQIGLSNLAVSVITVAELYYGALNKDELRKIKKTPGAYASDFGDQGYLSLIPRFDGILRT